MPGFIIAAALGSIAITGLLTFVLWRMNAPLRDRNKAADSGGSDGGGYVAGGSRDKSDSNDGTDGGSDGGGGDGGGGGK